jgi:hypothetical protein
MRRTSLCILSAVTLGWTVAAGVADDNRSEGRNESRNDRQNDTIIYSSIPRPLPGNVASVGPEAYAFREVGDGLVFRPGAGGTIDDVTVILSSWACKTGRWYTNDCATPKGATFSQRITLNIYAVIDVAGVPTQGALLGTSTRSFDIPFRPSSDPARCGATPGKWFSEKDKVCYNGLAVPVGFDLSSQRIAVPDRVIVGVAYNSTHYGPAPVGEATPCFTSSGGCPYDSLNVSSDGPGGRIGSPIDPNGIFVNYYSPSSYCQPHVYTGNNMQLDNTAGCWAGFHPQIEVSSTERQRSRPRHGNDPSD